MMTATRIKTFVGKDPQELDEQVNEFIRKEVKQLVSSQITICEGSILCQIIYSGDSKRTLFDPSYCAKGEPIKCTWERVRGLRNKEQERKEEQKIAAKNFIGGKSKPTKNVVKKTTTTKKGGKK